MGYRTGSGAVISIGVDGAEAAKRQIEGVGDSMVRVADGVKAKLAALAGAIGFGGGIAQIAATSDEYSKFTAQLKLATKSQYEYAKAYEDVKRIATDSQQALSATGVLYARISNGTRELGIEQKRVAAITETVNLALKVSGATATESASAQLQLSQAFASGTLRGEEFNAVNEAAPRLMQALADGIGVPVGALKKMAEEGQITSKVMADVLPKAMDALREEAKQVQTIGGAFTVLKNNVMEFVGTQAQANGTVMVLTTGLGWLAGHINTVVTAMGAMTAVKVSNWIASWTIETYKNVAANRLQVASTLATAEANVVATGSVSALTAARVLELKAAALSAEGNVALAIVTNGLIPAQVRAAEAAAAHAAALAAQAAATNAASVSAGVLRGAMAFLGGPIGIITTLLGIGATAWAFWGESGKKAETQVTQTLADEIDDYIGNLNRQIEKLKERNALVKAGAVSPTAPSAESEKKRESILVEMKKIADNADFSIEVKSELLRAWGSRLNALTVDMQRSTEAQAEMDRQTRDSRLTTWYAENGTNAQKLAAELEKLRKQFGTIPPEMEKLVRARFPDEGAKAITKEAEAYTTLTTAIMEKIVESGHEASGLKALNEAQKLQVALNEELRSGKLTLTAQHKAAYEEKIKELGVNLKVIESQKRAAAGAAEFVKMQKEHNETVAKSIAAAIGEAEKNEELARTFGMTKGEIEALDLARLQEQLSQRSSLGLTIDEINALEKLIDAKRRSADAMATVDRLGLEKKANEESIREYKSTVEKYNDIFRNGFASMLNKGEGGWRAFNKSMITTFKTTVVDQLYKMLAQPFVVRVIGTLLGVTGGGISGAAQAATGAGGGALGAGTGLAGSMLSAGSALNYGYVASGAAYGTGFGTQQSVMLAQQEAGMGLNASTGLAGTIASGVAGGLAAYGFGEKYGAGAGMAAGVGSVAAGGAIAGGLAGTGMMAGATAALAAIPVWGWAAIAGMAILGGMQDGPEKNTRLGFTSNNAPGAISINERGNEGKTGQSYIDGSSAGAFGSFGVSSSFWMNAAQPVVQDFIKSVTATDDALAQFMSTTERASVQAALTGKTITANMGAEGTNPNADGALDKVFAQRIRAILDGVDSGLSSLVDGFAGTSQQLATETAALLQFRSALKDSGVAVFGTKVSLQEIAALKGPSEATSAALARITGIFNVTNAAADAMGKSTTDAFGVTGLASLAAREQLIQLSGGVENLGKVVAYFAQNFTSEAERMAPVIKALGNQMNAIGLADITSLEQFKNKVFEVGSAALKGDEEAAKLYTTLLAIAPQFKVVDDYLKTIGGTIDKFSDVAAKSGTVALAQKDVSDALRAVSNALDELRVRAGETQAGVVAAQKASTQAYFVALDAETAAKAKVVEVTRQLVDGMHKFSTNVRDFILGMKGGQAFDSYAALKAQLQTTAVLAQGGDAKAQEQLTTVAQKFLESAEARSSSALEYARDESSVKRLLTGVADAVDARAAELLKSTPAAGVAGKDELSIAKQELADAQLKLLGYAAAAAAAGASTDRSMQLVAGSAADLVEQFELARQANAKAQSDYAAALNLTSGMSLQSAGSINAFLTTLAELSTAQGALATAQADLSKSIVDAASKSAVSTVDYAKSLGLTGDSAIAFAKVMDDAKLTSSGYAALLSITGLSALDLNLALGSSGVAADQMAIVLANAGTAGGTLAGRLVDAHLNAKTFADAIKVSGLAADNLSLIFGVSGKSSDDLKKMFDDAITKGDGIGTAIGATKNSAQDLTAILMAAGLDTKDFKDLIKATGLSADALVAVLGSPGGADGLRGTVLVAGVSLDTFTASANSLGLSFTAFKAMLDQSDLTAADFEKIKKVTGKPTEDLGLYLTQAGMSGKELADTLDKFKVNAEGLPVGVMSLNTSVLAVAGLLGTSAGDSNSIASMLLGTGKTLVDLQTALGFTGAAANTMTALLNGFQLPTIGTAVSSTSPMSAEQAFISATYQTILDRLPDPVGLDYWTKNLKDGAITYENAALNIARGAAELGSHLTSITGGVTQDVVNSDITHGTAWLRAHSIPGFDVGTGFVPHDMLANIHKGEEITPRPYVDIQRAARDETNDLLQRLLTSNEALATKVALLQAAADKTATNTGATAASVADTNDTFNNITRGGWSVQTREAGTDMT